MSASRLATVLLLCACVSVIGVVPAAAQGVSVLNPLAREYTLRGFVWKPPAADGWREIGSAPDAVRLVYAEQLPENQVLTRVDFVAQAFVIDDPSKVPDGFTLARMSMSQRMEEKKEQLVAVSQLQQVPAPVALYEYVIVSKEGDSELYENHFVALAPDKSQYLAARFVTTDKEFRSQPYYPPFHEAMRNLRFPLPEADTPSSDKKDDAGSGTGGGDAQPDESLAP